jgi:hypothetical protein
MQRWALCADLHTGSPTGLSYTPRNAVQVGLLNRYNDAISWFGERPDVLLVDGDVVEGVDPKLEIDDPAIASQFLNSIKLITMWRPKTEYIIITGTKTHTHVMQQELEPLFVSLLENEHRKQYGEDIKVTVKRKLNTLINDWFLLSARHFVSSSTVYYSRSTAPVKSQMWSVLNSAIKAYENESPVKWPNLLVFGHTHYYDFHENAWGATLVLPSWKALGDKYGEEICDGHVDLGAFKLEVSDTEEEGWSWDKRLYYAGVAPRMESR